MAARVLGPDADPHAAPAVLIPGWNSPPRAWQAYLASWGRDRPVWVLWTSDQYHLPPKCQQFGLAGTVGLMMDANWFTQTCAPEPAWVCGVSTGARVASFIAATVPGAARAPLILGMPQRELPVPSSVDLIWRVPRELHPLLARAANATWGSYARASRRKMVFDGVQQALAAGNLALMAASAKGWQMHYWDVVDELEYRAERRMEDDPADAGSSAPVLVVGVAGDSFHDPAEAHAIAGLVDAQYWEAPSYLEFHCQEFADQLAAWAAPTKP